LHAGTIQYTTKIIFPLSSVMSVTIVFASDFGQVMPKLLVGVDGAQDVSMGVFKKKGYILGGPYFL